MYAEIGSPGEAIERLGLKGKRIGGARVSPFHANFIINEDNATANDVLTLIKELHVAVSTSTGHQMDVEVAYVGSDGYVSPALTSDCGVKPIN